MPQDEDVTLNIDSNISANNPDVAGANPGGAFNFNYPTSDTFEIGDGQRVTTQRVNGQVQYPQPPPSPIRGAPQSFSSSAPWLNLNDKATPLQQWNAERANLAATVQQSYADAGTFAQDVAGNSRGYQSAVNEAYRSGGVYQDSDALRPIPGAPGAFASFMASPRADAIGFGAMQTMGAWSSAYQQTSSGQFVTPEQNQIAMNGMAPGIGAMVGGAIGGLPGAMIGSGLAAAGSSVADAGLQREETSRVASERLAAILGSAADSISQFKTAIDSANVPVAQLAQGLGVMAGVAPGVNAGSSVVGASAMAMELRQNYVDVTSSVGQQLGSDPAQFSTAAAFGNDPRLSQSTYNSLGTLALSRGDMAGYGADRQAALASRKASDPAEVRLARSYEEDTQGTHFSDKLYELQEWANSAARSLGVPQTGDGITATELDKRNLDAYDKAHGYDDNGMTASDKATFTALGSGRLGVMQGQSSASVATASFGLSVTEGASPAALRGLLPGIDRAENQRIASDKSLIATYRGLQTSADPVTAADYQLNINKLGSDVSAAGAEDQGATRSVTGIGIATTSAQYDLAMTQGRVGGKTEAQLGGLVASQTAYLNRMGVATGTDLSQAEQAGLKSEAATTAYSYMTGTYAQQEGTIGAGIASASGAVGVQEATGSVGDVYSAQQQQLAQLLDLHKQITTELASQKLSIDDQNDATKRLASNTSAIAQLRSSSQQQEFAGTRQQIGYDLTGSLALQTIAIRERGSAGYDPSVNTDYTRMIAQDASNAATSIDPKLKRYWQMMGQEDTAARDTNEINGAIYQPDAATAMQGGILQTRSQLSQMMPWMMGGDQSDPWRANMAYLGWITGQESLTRQKMRDTSDPAANEANQAYLNSLQLDEAGIQRSRMTEVFKALPEMIAGGQGGGIGAAEISGQAALSAFYQPNGWMSGTFGRSSQAPHMAGLTATSPAGGFQDAVGAKMSVGMSADGSTQQVGYLARIASAIEKLVTMAISVGNSSGPPQNVGGPIKRELSMILPGYGGGSN
jgi:hypothetical protein